MQPPRQRCRGGFHLFDDVERRFSKNFAEDHLETTSFD
jgi:hypothetical protein